MNNILHRPWFSTTGTVHIFRRPQFVLYCIRTVPASIISQGTCRSIARGLFVTSPYSPTVIRCWTVSVTTIIPLFIHFFAFSISSTKIPFLSFLNSSADNIETPQRISSEESLPRKSIAHFHPHPERTKSTNTPILDCTNPLQYTLLLNYNPSFWRSELFEIPV